MFLDRKIAQFSENGCYNDCITEDDIFYLRYEITCNYVDMSRSMDSKGVNKGAARINQCLENMATLLLCRYRAYACISSQKYSAKVESKEEELGIKRCVYFLKDEFLMDVKQLHAQKLRKTLQAEQLDSLEKNINAIFTYWKLLNESMSIKRDAFFMHRINPLREEIVQLCQDLSQTEHSARRKYYEREIGSRLCVINHGLGYWQYSLTQRQDVARAEQVLLDRSCLENTRVMLLQADKSLCSINCQSSDAYALIGVIQQRVLDCLSMVSSRTASND